MDSQFWFNVGIIVLPLLVGYGFGQWNERRHFKSILRREAELRSLMAFSSRHVPGDADAEDPAVVVGSTVISVDYFKSFLAALRNIFGGSVSSYETLMERARRESILRMKLQAKGLGADVIFNVRLETSPVFGSGPSNKTRSIEVLAYGTAIRSPAFRS